MRVGHCCRRGVIAIQGEADLVQVAQLMREQHVGFVVVYAQGDDIRKPTGVLTDRDIVLGVIAKGVDPHSVTVQEMMARQPLVASESDELADVLQAMRMAGVRRVPVVDERGALTGVFALDDAIGLATQLLGDISGAINNEQYQEWRAKAE